MKISEHLQKAFNYISEIKVSGDDVERVALARAELRCAWAKATETPNKEDTAEEVEHGQNSEHRG